MVQISGALTTIPSHDWTCIYEREIDCSMSNEYLWLMEFQVAWGVFVVSATNHSLFTKSLVQDLEFFGNVRNFFPFQPWTIFPRKLTWELGSCIQKMAPVHCQSCCFRWRGKGLRVMPSQCNQSGKLWLWHHRRFTISGTLRVWRSSCLACCYGSLDSKAGRTWRQQWLSCGEDISVNCASGNWTRTACAHGKSQHRRIRGFHTS
jgi:hypothetical protein